jgi:6-phosphogluconolactonase (cycloisomerase 2 family)
VFAYIGCRTSKKRNARGVGISVYRVEPASHRWTLLQLIEAPDPTWLCFDQSGARLYAVQGDGDTVGAYAVDVHTGRLTFLNRQSTGGRNPVHVVVDPTNRYLVLPNYATGTMASVPLNADGSLAPVGRLVPLPGEPGPHKSEQTSSHPHHSPIDPAGRFVVVPDKGLDRVFVLKLDAENRTVAQHEPFWVNARKGAAPRHVDFHPTLPRAYVINELDSTITTYHYDGERGTLSPLQVVSTLPETFTGNSKTAEIVVAPSGKFLFGSNRGHDSIVVCAIDPESGFLKPVSWEPTQGGEPRHIALDPSGAFLYAANEYGHNIVAFALDPKSGTLAPTGLVVETGSPVCILFAGGNADTSAA